MDSEGSDLSLCWPHMSYCGFHSAPAHLYVFKLTICS